MKFSKNTLLILKNFTSINQGLWFRNEQLITVSEKIYNLVAVANIGDEIKDEFGIYDLSRFLGVLSLFDHEAYLMDLIDKVVIITEGDRQQVKYVTCEKKVLDLGPKSNPEVKGVKMPTTYLAEFTLPAAALKKTLSVSNVMSTFDKVAIKGNGGSILITALNSKDPTSDLFSYKAGETKHTFDIMFPLDSFQKLMDDTYNIKVAKGIAQFGGALVNYYLTPESTSTYE